MAAASTGPTRPDSPAGPSDPTDPAAGRPGWDQDDTHILGMAPVTETTERDGSLADDDLTEDLASLFGPEREPDGSLPRIDPAELAGLQDQGAGAATSVRRVLPLEDEPSNLVARYLFPTERYRGEWRRHIIYLAKPLSIGVLATLALGWLAGSLVHWGAWPWLTYTVLMIWIGVMGYVGWRVADWHFDRFILTNKRVMVVRGIIKRDVGMMPLLRVTDMKYEQTPLGRILNYGTFVLESAGQDQALREVAQLPNPNELYLRVVEEMYDPGAVEARLDRSGDGADA